MQVCVLAFNELAELSLKAYAQPEKRFPSDPAATSKAPLKHTAKLGIPNAALLVYSQYLLRLPREEHLGRGSSKPAAKKAKQEETWVNRMVRSLEHPV